MSRAKSSQRGAANRLTAGTEDPAGEMGDLANRRGDGIVDDQKIVIGVEGQLVWIKRPLRHARSLGELFGKHAGREERELAQSQAPAQKTTPTGNRVE